MRAVDAIMECLKAEGVDAVFGIPGGANLPTYDALYDAGVRNILCRHEQGAGHAAEGYAKATGKVGVALATSGPGATNLVTPIADAMLDSVPTVFITGQVRTDLMGTDGFQEADTIGITMPVVKHSFQVLDPRDIPNMIHEAFYIASTGRPGPVLVDVPQDLSRADIPYDPSEAAKIDLPGYKSFDEGNVKQIRLAAKALANARRPVIYSGGGVINGEASQELRDFVTTEPFPITSTVMGLGAFPADHEQWMGMLGMHGTRTANYAMDGADLIVAIGARFDDRITGKLSEFAPRAKFIHIDVDPAEISKNVPAHIPIVGDCKLILPKLTAEYRALEHGSLPPRRVEPADPQVERGVAARVRGLAGRRHPAPAHGPGHVQGDRGQRDRDLGRRPAPDVVRAALRLHEAAHVDQLRRPRHDGLRPALGARRQGREAGRAGRLPRRRRQPGDDLPGAGDMRRARRRREGVHHEQRLPRHGAPVAGAVLGEALQRGRHGVQPRLGQAGGGVRRRRHARQPRRRGRGRDEDRDRHRWPGGARRARAPGGELLSDDPGRCRCAGYGRR